MKINMKKEVQIDVTTLKIYAKCSDMFGGSLVDAQGDEVHESEYVYSFMPGSHYGDYIILNIDLATGQILNWTPPTSNQIEDAINKED